VSDPLVEALLAGLLAQSCAVHPPVTGSELAAGLAQVVARHRADGGPRASVALPDHELLDGAAVLLAGAGPLLRPWDAAWRDGIAGAAVGVGVASLAAADPGTVALRAGPGSPRATTLLPRVAVLVVPASTIVADLGTAFGLLASEGLASQVAWVSGPSRTGDLEMTLTFGVHGPKVVEVLVVTDR
jgi:L-lactate utilization protein LutC